MVDLGELQDRIGIQFEDESFLKQALIHSSYLNESPGLLLPSNERLEFLGDALLEMVITEMLYHQSPPLTEGEMTRLRATLVCGETLAHMAETMQLGDYLYLGRGEEGSGGRKRQSNLADAMEALIGAIFVGQGFEIARDFVTNLFADRLRQVMSEGVTSDYKSRLQELLQATRQVTPIYRTVKVAGPDHDRAFAVEVLAGDVVIGRGRGKSKRAAESTAALDALRAEGV